MRRVACLLAFVALIGPAQAFDFDDVAKRAAALAAQSYKPPQTVLPKAVKDLSYDEYRDIRFKPARSLWRAANLPFEVQLFHPGLYYDHPVRVFEVVAGVAREVRFDPELFDYGKNQLDKSALRNLGFAGFRVHMALNTPKYKDEVLVFQGASYFRALGKDQRYGLSARGVAIDTALASGEEFPRFTEFWIERPAAQAREITIYALLDSESVAGAYRFVVRPGNETVTLVKARLYLRKNVAKLGIAPLTSMFFFGENQPRTAAKDYRPEVHDSDILLIQSGTGEWITRPLVNPKRLLVTSFAMTNPMGFGLMQRDRLFDNYQDLEARYELRPSAWIEPRGNWGKGRIELVQIPTPDETNDNIVTFWVPDEGPALRAPLDFEYRIRWQKNADTRPPLAWVAQTRRGHGYMRQADSSIGFVIDFEGPSLKDIAPDKVESVVTVDANGQVVENHAYRNEVTDGFRLRLRVKPVDDKKPLEIRAFLRAGDTTLTPTWSYIVPPE
jgi:glucans biosynthesis protein